MLDAYITSMNTQITTSRWINDISENLLNVYTPGYQEKKFKFHTFLDGSMGESYVNVREQGKAIPSNSDENIYLEGQGYFVLRNGDGRIAYTRFGDFKFDGDGVYRSSDGQEVQGYLLNEKGEIMHGAKAVDINDFEGKEFKGTAESIPTTNIKLWIDPVNGLYLGKYEEFEFKDDGILYGKYDKGKVSVPLYKVAITNFNNPHELFEISKGQFIETENSGKAVIGAAQVRGKVLEQSNVDFDAATMWYQQAQFQLSVADMISKQYRNLLEQVMGLMGQ